MREYNAAVRDDKPFDPNGKDGRGTIGLAIPKWNWALTIDTPPFEAYAITCGSTNPLQQARMDPRYLSHEADA